jgi:bifunctional UDP-N-acetylglucosamine pyrophosphorylase/glucosamine-1-phosphate N-acetyltransferase
VASDAPAAVILAAGQGTRMRSALPKVAHPVAGRAMVAHVVRAARAAGADRIVVVVGHGADAVTGALSGETVTFALQDRQLGTGHALACAREALAGHEGPIFVLNGDGPLLRPPTLVALAERRTAEAPDGMALATVVVDDPSGLGRIVRDASGALAAIVEEADADAATRAVREVNPGIYLVGPDVWGYLGELRADNAQGEVYVTDLPLRYLAAGRPVATWQVADPEEVMAANDRVQLARLEAIARRRIAERWMRAGVTLEQPESAWIDDDVDLARDVAIEPFVLLRAGTRVGEGARIGAGCVLDGCEVAPGARVPPHTVARGRRFG